MDNPNDDPSYRIETEEQARNWVIELVHGVELSRASCNVVFPDDESKTARHQLQGYRRFLVRHGSALGTLQALHRCGKLGDVGYNELRQRLLNTLVPVLVGNSR